MRRVVVTGIGLVSCLGNRLSEVARALSEGRSGITHVAEYSRLGFRSCVAGIPSLDEAETVPRRLRRYMSDASLYAYLAAQSAIRDACLSAAQIADPRTGVVVGSGVGSLFQHAEAVEIFKTRGPSKVPPYIVPQSMGSTTSANLVTALGIRGVSYSLTSACATSAHSIGHAAELIQLGKQDCMIAGGAEEVRWTSTLCFDAMGALSTSFNDCPQAASRPYDRKRDGFVIAGGAGILMLEALDCALARGARIRAELVGYGATSDGADMVTPDPDGAARAMRLALEQAGGDVDYINAHATSTQAGDAVELEAIRRVFGHHVPLVSSTKGLTGHPIAAAGAHEAIYCLLMMENNFIAGCVNLDDPDEIAEEFPLVRNTRSGTLDTVMSNSFGFGGTNASLVFRRFR